MYNNEVNDLRGYMCIGQQKELQNQVERSATHMKFVPAVALVLLAWSGCDVGYAMFLVCVGKYKSQYKTA